MIAAAVVLPYLSVVFANGGRERIEAFPTRHARTSAEAIDGTCRDVTSIRAILRLSDPEQPVRRRA